jgi:flagellar basal-body rod protein FlgC
MAVSDLNKALKMSAAGMKVQSKRLLVIAQNLANVDTRATEPGGEAYRRKLISFHNKQDFKSKLQLVDVSSISRDQSPFKLVYSPEDPGANQDGYVAQSNVNPFIEMADMREASRSHEANLRAFEKALSLIQETIGLLRN